MYTIFHNGQYKLKYFTLFPCAHSLIFCQIQVKDNIEVQIQFFVELSAHMIHFFISDKKSHIPYNFLSKCHFAHPVLFFIGVVVL